jgi:hypothetical protein
MLKQGINVPDQDAAWEMEGMFDDLYQRYGHCDAEMCACSKGRNHQEGRGPWRMILCSACGQAGRHFRCLQEQSDVDNWECEICATVKEGQAHPTTDISVDHSSPECHANLLPAPMGIYTSPSINNSFSSGHSSPIDATIYANGARQTHDISQSSCASEQRLREQLQFDEESMASVPSDKDDDDSVVFVQEIPAPGTGLSMYNFSVDLQAETDSEPSEPEQSVYGWSVQKTLRQC